MAVKVSLCRGKALHAGKSHQAKHHAIDSYFILNALKVILAGAMIFNGISRITVPSPFNPPATFAKVQQSNLNLSNEICRISFF